MGTEIEALQCGAVWSGSRDEDLDVCSRGLTASLYSRAADGGQGGDVYFMSSCGGDQLTRLAVADVVGHGERVSKVGKWLLDAMKKRIDDPDGAAILGELNRLAGDYGSRAITTVCVIGYYRPTQTLTLSSAGHPEILVRHAHGGWSSIGVEDTAGPPSNLPLAVLDDVSYGQREVSLAPGDRVFVYTDGVTELPNDRGERFGLPRLMKALDAADGQDIAAAKASILDEMRAFGGSFAHDDVTLVLLEINALEQPSGAA